MAELQTFIKDEDLEKKLEWILIYKRGRIDERCVTCNGLKLLHRDESRCMKSDEEHIEHLPVLKQELLEKVEDFLYRRSADLSMMPAVIEMMKENKEMNRQQDERMIKAMKENKEENNRIIQAMAERTSEDRGRESVLKKPKQPPVWGDETFERFVDLVQHWEQDSKDSQINKYYDLVEALKKKKDLEQNVLNVVLDRTSLRPGLRTVNEVLKVLKEKFERTFSERTEGLVEKIFKMQDVVEETGEKIWDKFYGLVGEFEKLELNNHPRYLLAMMFLGGLSRSKKVTEEEKRRMMEIVEKGDRSPKGENELMDGLRKEFMRSKVEGKRTGIVATDVSSTYYAEDSRSGYDGRRRDGDSRSRFGAGSSSRTRFDRERSNGSRSSRYDEWKKSKDFGRYQRSDSRPGFYRTASRGNYQKSRSFSSKPTDNRKRSFSRTGEFVTNKQLMEELKKIKLDVVGAVVDELKKRPLNVAIVEQEEVEVSNVFFTDEEKQKNDLMIVDLGAPCSLVGKRWLETYVAGHGIEVADLKMERCLKKFRFGPGKIYVSEAVRVIPVVMKMADETEVTLEIKVYEVDASVPMLCGKDALEEWKAVIDVNEKTMTLQLEESDSRWKKLKLGMVQTAGSHLAVRIGVPEEWKTEDAVYLLKAEDDVQSYEKIKKIHEATGHKMEENLLYAYRNANKLDDSVRKSIKRVVESCKVCKKFRKSLGRPKVTLPKVVDFNEVVSLDLKKFGDVHVLWMVCSFTRFIQGKVLKNKQAETVIEALSAAWNFRFGYPSRGFWADNGGEFQNKEMDELANKAGFKIRFGPAYSPWSNGLNERNHYSADVVVKKVMEQDAKMKLEQAVDMAAWTHNTNVNRLGFNPLSLVTGKAVMFPGVTMGDLATDSMYDSETVRKIMERHVMMMRKFREAEYESKLKMATTVRKKAYNDIRYKEGDLVFIQEMDQKCWKGPVKVLNHRGRDVYVFSNGGLKKVADCRVQPYDEREAEEKVEDGNDEKSEETVEMRSLRRSPRRSVNEKSEETVEKNEVQEDSVGTFWMSVEKNECFDEELTVLVVEVPRKEHNRPEVIAAKEKEVENIKDYAVFEEIEDDGQERITSRWVITKKTAWDGQKQDYKAQLVARGFQETIEPQSDSPTALRESGKLFYSVAANEGFELRSIDIRAAFLQSHKIDREVFVEPPSDVKKEGIVWKLLKPIYGLKDASRKFWLRVKEMFVKEGMKTVRGDEAFYYKHDRSKLQGMILSHVDDFAMAGTSDFLLSMTKKVKETLNISKIEEDRFRFTGIDVKKEGDTIVISMEDYADSIQELKEIRKGDKNDPLTLLENKMYRKYVGKISWLAENCRPDLAVSAVKMAKQNGKATLKDLKVVNDVVKKIRMKENAVKFSRIGNKEDLVVTGIGDASYKVDEKAIGGNVVLLRNMKDTRVLPVYWKSKMIRQVCHSAKEAETKNMLKLMDEALYQGSVIEQVLFDGKKKVEIKIYTDSKPLLDSVASSKQVEKKMMRPIIADMKDKLIDKSIVSFKWLRTDQMVADMLTKERTDTRMMDGIIMENRFDGVSSEMNKVLCIGGELRMVNRTGVSDGS